MSGAGDVRIRGRRVPGPGSRVSRGLWWGQFKGQQRGQCVWREVSQGAGAGDRVRLNRGLVLQAEVRTLVFTLESGGKKLEQRTKWSDVFKSILLGRKWQGWKWGG